MFFATLKKNQNILLKSMKFFNKMFQFWVSFYEISKLWIENPPGDGFLTVPNFFWLRSHFRRLTYDLCFEFYSIIFLFEKVTAYLYLVQKKQKKPMYWKKTEHHSKFTFTILRGDDWTPPSPLLILCMNKIEAEIFIA